MKKFEQTSFNKQKIESQSMENRKNEFEYQILKDKTSRETLKQRIEELIDEVQEQNIDFLVFLDKSARPFSWLFRDMWKKTVGEEETPEIRFVNIGRSCSFAHEVQQKRHRNETDESMGEDASSLKKSFGKQFDNKSILIIDDLAASGRTLRLAEKEFRSAFHDTSVFTKTLYQRKEEDKIPWMLGAGYQGVVEAEDSVFTSALTKKNVKKIKDRLEEILFHEMPRLTKDLKIHSDNLRQKIGNLEDEIKSEILEKKGMGISDNLKTFLTECLNIIEEIKFKEQEDEATEEEKINFFRHLSKLENHIFTHRYKISDELDKTDKKCVDIIYEFQDIVWHLIRTSSNIDLDSIFKDIEIFKNYDKLKKRFLQLRKELKNLAGEE